MKNRENEIRTKRENLRVGDRSEICGYPAVLVYQKKKSDYITPLEFAESAYNRTISMVTFHFQDGTVRDELPIP